jgi:hypothetical protein
MTFAIGSTSLVKAVLALSLCAAGCTGVIAGDSPTSGTATHPGPGGPGGPGDFAGPGGLPGVTLDAGQVVLRRLNRVEYNNTVRDLLQTASHPADDFPVDQLSVEGFDRVGAVLEVSPLHVERYESAAIQLVKELFALPADSPARQKVLVCPLDPGSEIDCVRKILSAFVPRAYRRAATVPEIDELVGLASNLHAAGNSYQESLEAALAAVLLSPHFIFLVENDPEPTSAAVHPVTDSELATRLSYFLWSTMPDDELFASAGGQRLTKDPAELARQVARMLDSPRAAALADDFASQWLGVNHLDTLSRNSKVFPLFDAALTASAGQETRLFFQTLLKESQPLEALLLADFTVGDARMASHYGLGAPAASGFSKLSLAGTQRIGALTHASVLMANAHADRTSPVLRGVWVLERLLCSRPPPPPADVAPLGEARPGLTLRESLAEHRANPACAACHTFFEPIGLAFENFDGIGAYRTLDGGVPVDASGIFSETPFKDAAELAPLLAKDPRFAPCVAQQLLTYAVGRSFEDNDSKNYVNAVVQDALAKGKGNWRSWVEMVTTTAAFQTRRGVSL